MKIIIDEREHDLYNKCLSIINENSLKYKNIFISKKVLPLGDILIKTDDENVNFSTLHFSSQVTEKGSSKLIRKEKNKTKIPFDKDILLIERKTFSDLLASIRDGRYNEQSHRLTYSSGLPSHNIIYLLEGMFSQTKENDRKTIMSSITSLNYFKGFSVMRTANVKESAEWLICTADKIQRELNSSGRSAEKDQFFLSSEGKLTFLAEASPEPKLTFSLEQSVGELTFLAEQSVGENEFCGNKVEGKLTFLEEALPEPKINFTKCNVEKITFSPERSAEENQFCGNEVEAKLQDIEINILRDSSTLQSNEPHTPPDYCTVVKKEKGKNITPENIGTIFLCQIPLVHSVSAIAIMQKFSSFQELINSLVNNPNCLNDIYTETNGKKRKLSKAIIQNIKKYLGISTLI